MASPPKVLLTAGGLAYEGWKSIEITRSMESLAGSFELGVSDRWAGQAVRWPIYEEDECTVSIDGETVLTGWVDKRTLSFKTGERTFKVSGRDKAAALVDCSVVLNKWEFRNVALLDFVKKLCDPFGIRVSLVFGLEQPQLRNKITISPGDKGESALEKATKQAGVLAISDGKGGLVLTRVSSLRSSTALVEGQNLLEGEAEYDVSKRHREIIVLAQHSEKGKGVTKYRGRATDLGVARSERKLIINPDEGATLAYAETRAQWEAKVRAAKGDKVTCKVVGWKQSDGLLWVPNLRVAVTAPTCGISGEMLVTECKYKIDKDGYVTELSLKRPDAFLPEPVIIKGGEGAKWKELKEGVPGRFPGR